MNYRAVSPEDRLPPNEKKEYFIIFKRKQSNFLDRLSTCFWERRGKNGKYGWGFPHTPISSVLYWLEPISESEVVSAKEVAGRDLKWGSEIHTDNGWYKPNNAEIDILNKDILSKSTKFLVKI